MSQVEPIILVFTGLLSGVLLYPLASMLAASGLGGFFDACARGVAAPFAIIGRLFSRRGYGEEGQTAPQSDKMHEEQIKASAQLLRKILLSVTVAIQRADQAASNSNQTLGDVRNSIGRMNLPDERDRQNDLWHYFPQTGVIPLPG
jgi:hypothetical protein